MKSTPKQTLASETEITSQLIPYDYGPLLQGSWIRVLALKPYLEHINEQLHFEFEHVLIDDAGHQDYIALSYAWGNKIPSETVICQHQCITITKTLLSALQTIRQPDKVVYVWADAICINQSASAEREQQVSMMDRIFAQASEVLVYLGEFSATDLEGVAAIRSFADANFDELDFSQRPSLGEMYAHLTEALKDRILPTLDSSVWASLQNLMARSWFTRLWIVQEYAVARKVSFIIGHGNHLDAQIFHRGCTNAIWYHRLLSVPLMEKLVAKGFTAAETVALWLPRYSLRKGYYLPMFEMQRLLIQVRSLQAGGNNWAQIATFRILYQDRRDKTVLRHQLGTKKVGFESNWRAAFGKPWWGAPRHSFFENYMRTRQFLATDPRDRVYALRGLCAENGIPELDVDYDNPSWQLAERISAHLIQRGHGIYVLTSMSLSTKVGQHGWRILLRESKTVAVEQYCRLVNKFGTFENDLFRAGGWEEKIQVLSDGKQSRASIGVPGINIGRVVKVCETELPELVASAITGNENKVRNTWWEGMKMQVKWYQDGSAWLKSIGRWIQSVKNDDPSFELECWRALCCGLTFDARGQRELIDSRPGQFDPGVAIMECTEAYSSLWSLFWRFMNRNVALPWEHIITGSDLQLAVDSSGRICTVPIGSEPGDLVCLFKGFPLPFVLRPNEDGTFKLMGAAYVQGVMNGNLYESMHREHMQTFVLEPGPQSDEDT